MFQKRSIALVLALALAVTALSGCTPAGDSTTAPAGTTAAGTTGSSGTTAAATTQPAAQTGPDGRVVAESQVYRTMYSGEVTTMNYLVDGTTNNLVVAANTIDALVEYDSYGNIQPGLALSWSESADGLTWTFTLRQGVKWYDCEGNEMGDVTAHDWVASALYVLDANNNSSSTYMLEDWLVNAAEYWSWTASQMTGYDGEPVPEVKPEEVGVRAVDDYTLEYTLATPRPYFLSALTFAPYYPAPVDLLASLGENFALDNYSIWFNGAYLLKEFEPQVKRVYVKNQNYWDAGNVHIEEIRQTYNAEAAKLTPELFMRGQVDYASIDNTLIADWLADPAKASQVAPSRPTADYSYFFLFNFEPKFDAEYEPDNWIIAVNNENFRQSIYKGLDRLKAMKVIYPDNAEDLIENSITPKTFVNGAKGSYASYGDLAALTSSDTFNESAALDFKNKAVAELQAAGAKLPIIIPLTYNSSMDSWGQECVVIEQQLEALLGTDYIDIKVVAGPSTGFLAEVRRAGKYGLMKCNWGADYADPETWTDPFTVGSSYNFMYDTTERAGIEQNTKTAETAALYAEYIDLVNAAKAETSNLEKRFELFAKAEAFLINHAFALPFGITGGSYQASKLNPFEGQYAVFGLSNQKYKGQRVYETGMGWDAFRAQYDDWYNIVSGN